MTAKKKTIIALIVGAVLGIVICVGALASLSKSGMELSSEYVMTGLLYIPAMMLYAFGYAFGWKRCKGFIAKAAKVSADIAFISIIVQLIVGKGLGKGLMIAMLVFSFAIGIVWMPGVVWGIQQLIAEHKKTVQSV